MPPSEQPAAQLIAQVDRLLKQGDAMGALRAADQLLAQSKRSFPGWLGRAVALMNLGQVAEAERSIVPCALEVLGLPHESLVYEDFVADPAGHAARCLQRMGLGMDARVLAPEANARAVFTLSHEQVRRPINSASIGRWRNYAFAFDGSWDALAAAHDARRTAR